MVVGVTVPGAVRLRSLKANFFQITFIELSIGLSKAPCLVLYRMQTE